MYTQQRLSNELQGTLEPQQHAGRVEDERAQEVQANEQGKGQHQQRVVDLDGWRNGVGDDAGHHHLQIELHSRARESSGTSQCCPAVAWTPVGSPHDEQDRRAHDHDCEEGEQAVHAPVLVPCVPQLLEEIGRHNLLRGTHCVRSQ